MTEPALIRSIRDLPAGFQLTVQAARPAESGVLVCDPSYFRVESALNPHMVAADGTLNRIDEERAQEQWRLMVEALSDADLTVEIIPGVAGLPDMVFTANQSFPYVDNAGRQTVLLSKMRTFERGPEVDYFARWYRERGWNIADFVFAEDESLEGMGDLLWLPGRRVVFAGIGPRTSEAVVGRLPALLGCPVLALDLVDPRYYHLDTALVPLADDLAMACRAAFSKASWDLLARIFDRIIEPPDEECASGFACNALLVPEDRILIDALCPETAGRLQREGFDVRLLDTSEFRKSGGSVFCMTMLLP